MVVRQTSIEAYETIKANGSLAKMRWMAYDALFHHGPMTGPELNQLLQSPHMHKTLDPMKKLGVVREIRIRSCTISGHDCIEWDVTNQLPSGKVNGADTIRPSATQMQQALKDLRNMAKFAQYHGMKCPESIQALGKWLAERYG